MIVSQTKKKFILSEELLASTSFFFKVALSNKGREGQERMTELPEDNDKTFELYVQWLYTGKIWSMESPEKKDGRDDKTENAELNFLALAYCLGEKYQDCDFKDGVLDAMKAHLFEIRHSDYDWVMPAETIRVIWNNTPPHSRARRFILDCSTYFEFGCEQKTEFAGLDPHDFVSGEFFKDLAFAFASSACEDTIADSPLEGPDGCIYHEHTAAEKCYKRRHPE